MSTQTTPCKKHRYGEPDQQGYVTCWDCGDTFNLADDNDDEDYEKNYIDYGDDDLSEGPEHEDGFPITTFCG